MAQELYLFFTGVDLRLGINKHHLLSVQGVRHHKLSFWIISCLIDTVLHLMYHDEKLRSGKNVTFTPRGTAAGASYPAMRLSQKPISFAGEPVLSLIAFRFLLPNLKR